MTEKEACQILGLAPKDGILELKKKYRKLMIKMHPDAGVSQSEAYAYNAKDINVAYSVLKELLACGALNDSEKKKNSRQKKESRPVWNAPVNPNAYMERDVLQYAEGHDGSVLGSFLVARGKYMWTAQEDFPLFLCSLYQCSKKLLEQAAPQKLSQANKQRLQAELSYLLAQQFISHAPLLEELAKKEEADPNGNRVFYIPAMIEFSREKARNQDILSPGTRLCPSGVRSHRLYLKNDAGKEIGYLSFLDDRLYYIVIPLFEQKAAQVKIIASDKQPTRKKRTPAGYQCLHLWLKLLSDAFMDIPSMDMTDHLNVKIERLLKRV